jgi:S1-C subfamily serine protease
MTTIGNFVEHGCGFIVDIGTVVTNYHVVKGAYSLKVRVDNRGVKTYYN